MKETNINFIFTVFKTLRTIWYLEDNIYGKSRHSEDISCNRNECSNSLYVVYYNYADFGIFQWRKCY